MMIINNMKETKSLKSCIILLPRELQTFQRRNFEKAMEVQKYTDFMNSAHTKSTARQNPTPFHFKWPGSFAVANMRNDL